MARVLCAYSGIEFKTDHFPIYLTSREHHHPIFSASTSDLLALAPKYLEEKLSATENYLYYLALFNTTDLLEFRVPAIQTPHTQAIIASNAEALIQIVERIYIAGADRVRYALSLPKFVISPDTKDLSNSKYWIESWTQNYADYLNGYKDTTRQAELMRREYALERLIKDKNKDPSKYALQLAEWAARAAEFNDDGQIVADGTDNDKPIPLNEYWKKLIRMCCKGENIYCIHDGDLSELIDHLEQSLEIHGNIQAYTLMAVLRGVQTKKQNYLDLGDIDIGAHGTVFRILDADSSVEDANKLALIDSAPSQKPIESDYPSKLAYLRARTKWDMAEAYRKSEETRAKIESTQAMVDSLNQSGNLGRRSTDTQNSNKLIDKL